MGNSSRRTGQAAQEIADPRLPAVKGGRGKSKNNMKIETMGDKGKKVRLRGRKLVQVRRSWQLYVLLIIPVVWLIIFRYLPMSGVAMAFENFSIQKGIFGSEFVGLKYFEMFFNAPNFKTIFMNTITLSLYALAAGFPIPIILALALNECGNTRVKKFIQTITFAPYFISVVVLIAIFSQIFHEQFGIVNIFLRSIGQEPINILGQASSFQHLYVWSGVWQSAGYSAILYIAALSSIDPGLKEAATIDGASRFQKIWHIDIPGIMPTIIITLILSFGSIMSVGFEKAYIMQTPANLSVSEIIPTYVYKIGIEGAQYSYAAAIGVFNSLINFAFIVVFNRICKKVGETSLW